ncbi:MAG: 3-oxoacyl-[acyl-carrier-protein] synthase III C-terminal domain-containing protein [Bacteroidales bacterium]
MLIQAGACRRVLVCAGDTNSKLIHPLDKQVRMVFGDAGSAALVEASASSDWPFVIGTDGTRGDALKIPAGGCRQPCSEFSRRAKQDKQGNTRTDENLFMDGMEIMNFSLREIPPAIEALLAKRGWEKEEVGVYALHQANKFMVDYLRRKMKLPAEAVPMGIETMGNTGPASIPLLLTLKHEQLIAARGLDKTVMCGFGVGLSWAATAGNLSDTVFPDLVEVS